MPWELIPSDALQSFDHEVILISIPGIRIWDDLRYFYIIPGLKIELKKKKLKKKSILHSSPGLGI